MIWKLFRDQWGDQHVPGLNHHGTYRSQFLNIIKMNHQPSCLNLTGTDLGYLSLPSRMMSERSSNLFLGNIIMLCKLLLWWKSLNFYRSQTYKHYAAVAPSGLIPSIGTNVLGDIILHWEGLVDYKSLKLSDIDLEFVSTKAGGGHKYENFPERQLVRFQFLELLVRLSITKYFKSKIEKSISESVERSFNDHFLPFFNKFDSHNWRVNQLWTEQNDNVFKQYNVTLK